MKKILSLILCVILVLSVTSCDESKGNTDSGDNTATGTNAPIVTVGNLQKAFTDAFTEAYGDFDTIPTYDMTYFNNVLGDNYNIIYNVSHESDPPVEDENDVSSYYLGINRVGEDYCFEMIYAQAIEFIKCGDGYAYFISPEGLGWQHDDTIRTSREHLKRVYNGLAYEIMAPYNSMISQLQRKYTTDTYCDRECVLYLGEITEEYDGVTYKYKGEYYIDESTGLSLFSIYTVSTDEWSSTTTIKCDSISIGDARLDYEPSPYEYM